MKKLPLFVLAGGLPQDADDASRCGCLQRRRGSSPAGG